MNTPRVLGLVLAGGKSLRMGFDKSLQVYGASGKNQKTVTSELLLNVGLPVFVSCRKEQSQGHDHELWDDASCAGYGPATGLLTAHLRFPDAAWLVMAVDFPYATVDAVLELFQARDVEACATAFENDSDMIEPLFALWEPRGLQKLREQPKGGPRKVLEEGSCRRVKARNFLWLKNVNSPSERL